jgi:hypothetical protein
MEAEGAYGLWPLVVFNTALFVIFAASLFPILALVYRRLARAEEREVAVRFGRTWGDYAAGTPAFVPRRRPALGPPGGEPPTQSTLVDVSGSRR